MLALAMTAGVSAQVENKEAQAAINNIMTRTSIRQYTDEPVSKADVETMLRAGMAAPTAVNRQPWHFVAVTDKAKLAELAGRRGGMIVPDRLDNEKILQNVCYIKHFCISLHPIIYNYGKEYIRKDDA